MQYKSFMLHDIKLFGIPVYLKVSCYSMHIFFQCSYNMFVKFVTELVTSLRLYHDDVKRKTNIVDRAKRKHCMCCERAVAIKVHLYMQAF
jgi:hypothetical protein